MGAGAPAENATSKVLAVAVEAAQASGNIIMGRNFQQTLAAAFTGQLHTCLLLLIVPFLCLPTLEAGIPSRALGSGSLRSTPSVASAHGSLCRSTRNGYSVLRVLEGNNWRANDEIIDLGPQDSLWAEATINGVAADSVVWRIVDGLDAVDTAWANASVPTNVTVLGGQVLLLPDGRVIVNQPRTVEAAAVPPYVGTVESILVDDFMLTNDSYLHTFDVAGIDFESAVLRQLLTPAAVDQSFSSSESELKAAVHFTFFRQLRWYSSPYALVQGRLYSTATESFVGNQVITFYVEVCDVNEPIFSPILNDTIFVYDRTPALQAVYSYSVYDADIDDTFTSIVLKGVRDDLLRYEYIPYSPFARGAPVSEQHIGLILTVQDVNFETQPLEYNMTMEVQDGGSSGITDSNRFVARPSSFLLQFHFNITLLDYNDPFILRSPTTLSIKEEQPIGWTIHTLQIEDEDAINHYIFTIVSGNIARQETRHATICGFSELKPPQFDPDVKRSSDLTLLPDNRQVDLDDFNATLSPASDLATNMSLFFRPPSQYHSYLLAIERWWWRRDPTDPFLDYVPDFNNPNDGRPPELWQICYEVAFLELGVGVDILDNGTFVTVRNTDFEDPYELTPFTASLEVIDVGNPTLYRVIPFTFELENVNEAPVSVALPAVTAALTVFLSDPRHHPHAPSL